MLHPACPSEAISKNHLHIKTPAPDFPNSGLAQSKPALRIWGHHRGLRKSALGFVLDFVSFREGREGRIVLQTHPYSSRYLVTL